MELIDSSSAAELSDEDAMTFYFSDLASLNCKNQQSNNISGPIIISSEKLQISEAPYLFPLISDTFSRLGLVGIQAVKRGREENVSDNREEIIVLLILLRLTNVGTDLLVSLNIPIASVFKSPIELQSLASSLPSIKALLSLELNAQAVHSEYHADFLSSLIALRMILENFQILDWNLFKA